MSFTGITSKWTSGPGRALVLMSLVGAALVSCGEPAPDATSREAVTPSNVQAPGASDGQQIRYPEFERQQRVERIASLASSTEVGALAFETCASCHGADGFGSRDGQIPRLAGQRKTVLIEKLVEIAEGVRHRPEMEPFQTRIDEDGEIAALAAHIAALPDPHDVRHGSGTDLTLGKTTFEDLCASCHEADGRGDDAGRIPRIAGWDAPSIKRTLIVLRADYSEVHETGMSDLVSMMNEEEIDAVADYVSRLTPVAP